MARHPYEELSDSHFWSRVVQPMAFHEIDPVGEPSFQVADSDRVATLGSCFAQHLSRFLQQSGLNYFVTEAGDEAASAEDRARRNFGTFSARYGNVYTVRQAMQLLARAYGRWIGEEEVWRRGDVYVDSLRPQVEPEGFASEEELLFDRAVHMAAVRQVFEEADVLVFTLGLTEGWRQRETGLMFPVVPGASGGTYLPERYEFVNFTVSEVIADLERFVARLRELNPGVNVLLTVSPVPLIATYTDEHVLAATVYSKSVLRVAAADVSARFARVDYFPSFEIVTNPAAAGHYFADDLRSVTDEGVAHVMRVFRRHYIEGGAQADDPLRREAIQLEIARTREIICDEEVLDERSSPKDSSGVI